MIVRDFITQHPGATFDMMTPGGFVYLTPQKTKDLLDGNSVKGHPGCPEYAIEIDAEDLLMQTVITANYKNGAWNILTNIFQSDTNGRVTR